MKALKDFINKTPRNIKIRYLIIVIFVGLLISISAPSLAKYMNRSSIVDTAVWDGSIATSYRRGSGTSTDPYIISNGAELAYFAKNLENTDYSNTYFSINNDIVLNDGVFKYQKDIGGTYTKDNQSKSIDLENDSNEINEFFPMKNFAGHLDGNYYTIYGLFITDNKEEVGLFENLSGYIKNLYLDNSFIYGGSTTSGLAVNANNATISNFLYNGYVISQDKVLSKNIDINLEEFNLSSKDSEEDTNINVDIPQITGNITSIKLTGIATISGEGSLIIEDNEISDNFEINLSNLNNTITIKTKSTGEVNYKLTDLVIHLTEEVSNTAGLINNAKNLTIENTINKANVFGNLNCAGFINNLTGKSTIINSYNTGSINSNDIGSGLITNIQYNSDSVTLKNTYNSGMINSTNKYGLIGNIKSNSGSVSIENSFNTTDNYILGRIDSPVVLTNVVTSYNDVQEGNTTGAVTKVTDDIKNYVRANFSYNEFIDSKDLESNSNNVWVFDDTSLPILYTDDISNSLATINVSKYTWNNVGYKLNTLKFDKDFAFQITEVDNLRPIKEKYYYISKSREALSKSEIQSISNWTPYEDIVKVEEEGFYVIYAKVVDYNNNVYYLNTDLLVLDLTGSSITIKYKDTTWEDLRDNVKNIYLDKSENVSISALDELSGVDTISYYKSNEVLSKDEVESLESSKWTPYKEEIEIGEEPVIIYVKVVDNCNYITYANSDRLVVGGYKITDLIAGRNSTYKTNVNITDKSSITINCSFSDISNYEKDYTHSLNTNISLPVGTDITLRDNINSKVYKYKVEKEEKTIFFNKFIEVGKATMDIEYQEPTSGKINEDYTITFDFANAKIQQDLNDIEPYILLSKDKELIIPTVLSTKKKFNIIKDMDANLSIEADFNNKIYYNIDSISNIDFTAMLNYQNKDDLKIIDTQFEDKSIGLAIKLVNSKGETISKDYLKNIIFRIDDKKYSPSSDGVVRINLNNGLKDISKTLTIETYQDNSKLDMGDYAFLIGTYASFDGLHDKDINYSIRIPVIVSKNNNIPHEFNISINDEDRIIQKDQNKSISINILENSTIQNPSVKVSLYKKTNLSALNHDYTLIDLGNYLVTPLDKYKDYIYDTSINSNSDLSRTIELEFDTSKMEHNGYKLVFELYDGDVKVDMIDKKFIIK